MLQPAFKPGRVHCRGAKIVPLKAIDTHGSEVVGIFRLFNTFRHGQHIELLGNRGQCCCQDLVVRITGDTADELPVDLQDVEEKSLRYLKLV